MGQSSDLRLVLVDILGSNNVYFQPPPTFQMSFPCIVFELNDIHALHGDNIPYVLTNKYTITVMDSNPDSLVPAKVSKLSSCVFDRRFQLNGLYHTVFKILY